jgi:DNA-binding MarR family transcriptional regulator
MTERAAHAARVETIDRLFRELTWHGQKHAIHTLTRPEIGLTMPQMVTLLAIHDRGSCRMGTLADATQQSGGTLTGIVDRLIDDGLVERVRSVNDRRVIEVTLTAEGQARVRQVLSARHDDLDRILASFELADLEQFERLLGQFLQAVRGALPAEEMPARELEA